MIPDMGRVLPRVGVFLRSNGWSLAAATLGLSVALVALIFSLPGEYRKTFSLSVQTSLTELQRNLGQAEPGSPERATRLAMKALREAEYGPVEVTPEVDAEGMTVDVRLLADEASSLEGVSREAVEAVESETQGIYEESLGKAIDSQLVTLNDALQANQDYVGNIEEQLEISNPVNTEQARQSEEARLQSVETLREGALESRANIESKIEYLEGAREDLPRSADEVVSTEVIDESEVMETGSSASMVPYAVLFSLLTAVAGILRAVAGRDERQSGSVTT